MSIRRLLAKADMGLYGHLLNLRLDDARRRTFRARIEGRAVERYARCLLDAAARVEETPVVRDDDGERIFSLWLQGENEAPPLVKACFRSIRRNCTQPLVVLDEKTLGDYTELPGGIMDKYRRGLISHAHFADIVRVELLYRHGGYWLDSTDFVTAPIPDVIRDADFFVFMAGENINPGHLIQNCFIRARKGACMLAAWRAMMLDYWTKEPRAIDYFQHQFMFRCLVRHDPRAAALFTEMPRIAQDPTHTLWWEGAEGNPGTITGAFDREAFERLTAGAFFQKTSYKSSYAVNPPPGSMADEMICRMYL